MTLSNPVANVNINESPPAQPVILVDVNGNALSSGLNANVNISQVGGQAATNITLGQSTRVNSVPVTLASDQPDLLTKPDTTVITGSASALNATVIPSTDLSGYATLSFQATSVAASSTITFQCSNDNSTWQNLSMNRVDTNNASSDGSSTATTGVIFSAPVQFRYFKAYLSAYSSGTTSGTLFLQTTAGGTFRPLSIGLGAGILTFQDAQAISTITNAGAINQLYNGTNWDRQRGNQDNITLLASAGRTTTQTVADQTNYNARGVVVVLDMTNVGTGSVTLEIDGKDPVSGKYYAILTGAAVASNSTNVYTVYPGNTVTTNVSASTVLPRTWRVVVTANNANSATYSVGAMLII